ncbi:hypothetical protein EHE19_007050 [Ruminiclostridium herbifermentans]|uniref:YitT family protein n=1 Tax=Ruminiclostridium herbifermentans TaxID=2488810 RepID=A0A4U7JK05_9FIRM|nr:DUF6198 family protein [Ruminiclostridium herbifermentans]QNU68175.1 hypothetical protein EHE19_007050 [Ruminiclostridium herbifermentans]
MKTKGKMSIRLLCYFGGMLIMTLGVAVSVKSVLGVSPISSVPYTITVVSGMELGLTTTIFSIVAALLEIPILRKKYKAINLFQIPVSIVFGLFMTFCVKLVQQIPDPSSFVIKLILALISTVIVAIGVFLYVSSELIPLPTEGVLIAITQVTSLRFATLKVIGDVTMVIISLGTCLIVLHAFGSIGIGTIISAILVGNVVKILTKYFKSALNKAMGL